MGEDDPERPAVGSLPPSRSRSSPYPQGKRLVKLERRVAALEEQIAALTSECPFCGRPLDVTAATEGGDGVLDAE